MVLEEETGEQMDGQHQERHEQVWTDRRAQVCKIQKNMATMV